jgi:hypothetical protein
MPEIKHLFNAGRMNKDLDERLIPNGEYRDAVNIQLASTDGSDAGAMQNILGNIQITSNEPLFDPKFKCSVVDPASNKIYWFVKDALASYLFVYDDGNVNVLIKDLANEIFKFDDSLITGIAFFEGLITLTDNVNEPLLIDVNLFSDPTKARLEPSTGQSQLYNEVTDTWYNLTQDDITLIKKKPASAPTIELSNAGGVEDADPLFELKFVRFSYRWKFKNGQYSIFSPFSESAFLPGNFEFNAKKGYNTGMENHAKVITLKNIEAPLNDIEAVDILMKKSDDQSVYVVETILAEDLTGDFQLTSEQIYSIVSSNQLLRLWDAVPLKAKTVDVSSNRLIFANYEIGENTKGIKPNFNLSLTARGGSRKHIKSDRTYQFGVVFEDKYGRQTPVISNSTGSINVPFGNLDHMNTPQQFSVTLTDTLPTEAVETFDKFKYFIKDTSSEYYNVIADSIFPNPEKLNSTEVWMAMPSTEINKFKEGDFLHLKKGQNSSIPIANPIAKFKTLSVESAAPDFIGVAPDNPADVQAITNFDYENYNTKGRFFVRLEDIDGILAGLYQANVRNNAQPETITTFGSASYPSGQFLGEYRIYDSGGGYQERDFYFSESTVNPGTGNVAEFLTSGYLMGGSGFVNPQGTLVTETITYDSITIPASNNLEKWYNAGIISYSDGFPRYIYTRWEAENGQLVGGGLTRVEIVPVPGEEVDNIDPAVFETEPTEGFLDIYYETEEAFPIEDYNITHRLQYFNCYNFQNGVESNRIRDDFNAPYMDKQVRVSTVLAEQYKRSRNAQGFIWSGIFNSRNSVNRLNQFLTAEKITKDLNPEYGEIQLIHTRDTDVLAFCQNKVLRVKANKDMLYNADGSSNVAISNLVLSTAVPLAGEFGISNNPESFASYGYQIYFTDQDRGAVLRLSMDGLTVISNYGMSTYFRDRLSNNNGSIVGSYDIHTKQYIVSFENDESVAFSEEVKGWTSRLSFVPESGLFLDGNYFTFNRCRLWKHHNGGINNFYGRQYNSSVDFIFNQEPSLIKNFKTIGFEGSQANILKLNEETNAIERAVTGWKAVEIITDQQEGNVVNFKGKDGKWYNKINGIYKNKTNLNSKEFSVQGIGRISNFTPGDPVVLPTPTPTPTPTPSPTPTIFYYQLEKCDGGVSNYRSDNPVSSGEFSYGYRVEDTTGNIYTIIGAVENNVPSVGQVTYTYSKGCPFAPSVNTYPATNPKTDSLVFRGEVTDKGDPGYTARGFVWMTGVGDPDMNDNVEISLGSDVLGAFSKSVTNLAAGTAYSFRAYATNDVGTAYGDTIVSYTEQLPFTCSEANFVVQNGTTGYSVNASISQGNLISVSPSTYTSGTATYTGTIQAPAGYKNEGSNITCTYSAVGTNPPPPPTPTGPTPTPTEAPVEATCSNSGLYIFDGQIGDTVSAVSNVGTVVSITPGTYQSGTTDYTVDIVVYSGYTNPGATITCNGSATGSSTPPPPPEYTCGLANFVMQNGTEGQPVNYTSDGTVQSVSPSTYQLGSTTYTATITIPAGYEGAGGTINCTDTANGASLYNYYSIEPCSGGSISYARSQSALSAGTVIKLSDGICYSIVNTTGNANTNDIVSVWGNCDACDPPANNGPFTIRLFLNNQLVNYSADKASLQLFITKNGQPVYDSNIVGYTGDTYEYDHSLALNQGWTVINENWSPSAVISGTITGDKDWYQTISGEIIPALTAFETNRSPLNSRADACLTTPDGTKYHNGPGPFPVTNNTVYRTANPDDGTVGSGFWVLDNTKYIQTNSIGVVIATAICDNF